MESAPVVAALLRQLGHVAPASMARPREPTHAATARGAFPLAMLEEPAVDVPTQGYRLRIGGAGIEIVANEGRLRPAPGLFLIQLAHCSIWA